MSGLIGGLLKSHLESIKGYELSALNRRLVQGVECFQANITDLEAIKPAFIGKDVVVHLAASLDEDNWEDQLSINLIGTYNVYEAARLAGVKRVVFASSGGAIKGFEFVHPYDSIAAGLYDDVPEKIPMITHDMVRPARIYGAAKVWGEALGRHFSDAYGMSVVCVRIGSVTHKNTPRNSRERAVYLSHRDVVQIIQKCIDAPKELMYDIFFATSNNKWGYRDLEHARLVLGFEPLDSGDEF